MSNEKRELIEYIKKGNLLEVESKDPNVVYRWIDPTQGHGGIEIKRGDYEMVPWSDVESGKIKVPQAVKSPEGGVAVNELRLFRTSAEKHKQRLELADRIWGLRSQRAAAREGNIELREEIGEAEKQEVQIPLGKTSMVVNEDIKKILEKK